MTLALFHTFFDQHTVAQTRPYEMSRCDWALMSDLQTVRMGVPESVLLWRRARGEADPDPSEPGCETR
jgi:hypothetical protein